MIPYVRAIAAPRQVGTTGVRLRIVAGADHQVRWPSELIDEDDGTDRTDPAASPDPDSTTT